MIKVNLEDLIIVNENTAEDVVSSIFRATFAENVVVYVVDETNTLIGILTKGDYEKRCENQSFMNCVNKTPMVLTVVDDIEVLAQNVLWMTKSEFLPIVDSHGKLLFVYYQEKVQRLMEYSSRGAEAILLSQMRQMRKKTDKRLRILTDIDILSEEIKQYVVSTDDIALLDKDNDILILAFMEVSDYMSVMGMVKSSGIGYLALGCGCFRGRKFAIEDSKGVTDYCSLDNVALAVLRKEHARRGYYFCLPDMENICQVINTTSKIPGCYIEIGVFRGDTARLALHYMAEKRIKRKSYFFDTYEGFSYEAAKTSQDILWNGTHTTTSYDLVKQRLSDYDAECVKCNIITDELPTEITEIAVCNIDVDMEEAVYAALLKVKDKMAKGGIIIAEDYGHMPELVGACYAVNTFIEQYGDEFTWLYMNSGQMLLIKK